MVFWGVLLYSRVEGLDGVSKWLIPTFLIAIQIRVKRHVKLRLAFLFCLAGDVFINLTPWQALCVPSFALAHALLAVHFQSFAERFAWKWTIPSIVTSLLFIVVFHERIHGATQWVVLIAYLSVLSAMFSTSLISWKLPKLGRGIQGRMLVGSGLFFITDMLVIAQYITGNSVFAVGIWLCYPPALYLLSGMEDS